MRPVLLVLLLAACLPVATDLVGKACDEAHACGRGLFCVEGSCAVDQPSSPGTGGGPSIVLATPDAGGSGGGSAGGAAMGGGSGGGSAPSACDAGVEDCTNGRDDDCDGLADCADSECQQHACNAANPAAVCCGARCIDLSLAANNCGGCGTKCTAGQTCGGIASGPVVTGRCSCNNAGPTSCPAPSGHDQQCEANTCSCDEDDECGAGQKCRHLGGKDSPGICHY